MSKKKKDVLGEYGYLIKAIDVIGKGKKQTVILLGDPPECLESIVSIKLTTKHVRVVYSTSKYIECLMKINNWDYDTAVDWFDFNVYRSVQYIDSKNKPVFVK